MQPRFSIALGLAAILLFHAGLATPAARSASPAAPVPPPHAGQAAQAARAAADLTIADFEGADYGAWKTTGEAFGRSPAHGTLPAQMEVGGFEGRGLVNSYLKGDGAVGTLTSPEFRIERRYLDFLLGGGNHPGQTCINLLVGGKIVRSSTGHDSEHLEWATWDVAEFAGKNATIEIVDRNTGGWGHILVDQIVQTALPKAEPAVAAPLYHEWLRPQFHFTSRTNWINDPNGLVFYKGEYHLFFQHNPTGIDWGNMTWGHAVSTDLLHWRQLDDAIKPDVLGTIFSGSAVVDASNTAGFRTGGEEPIVCIYTSAGKPYVQSIAYSNDRGRTLTKYAKNPVLANQADGNRDPKVVWYAPTKQWIMALFLDRDKYALFSSPDLKNWKKLCDLPSFGSSECPDFFRIPIVGGQGARWVLSGASGNYLVGAFDGAKFTPEGSPQRFEFGTNYYAAQTYSHIPAADGRRIQIAWMSGGKYPGMPFNQQMSFPSELTLHRTAAGLRLYRLPVAQLDSLHAAHLAFSGLLKAGENPLAQLAGDLFDLRVEIAPPAKGEIKLSLRGTDLVYDAARNELRLLGKKATVAPIDGIVKLQVLLDRSSIEVFANDGAVTMSSCFIPSRQKGVPPLVLSGPGAKVKSLDIWNLKSCWPAVAKAP